MTDFEDALEYTRTAHRVPKDRAFLMLATEIVLALNDCELSQGDLSDVYRYDGPNDRGVDAYFQDDDNRVVIIIQAKSSQPQARDQQTGLTQLRDLPQTSLVLQRRISVIAKSNRYYRCYGKRATKGTHSA